MISGFESFPEGTKLTKPQGGLFVWAELPENINTTALLQKAVDNGVAYVPGTHFYPNGGHHNTIRLNFSNSPEDKIVIGMEKLAKVLKENI
jgi:2-aminoadipate transaminase